MLAAVTLAVTSPTLLSLALEPDRCPYSSPNLGTQAVAGLAGCCPALLAVRWDQLALSGRLVELLDLQGFSFGGRCPTSAVPAPPPAA